MKRIWTASLTIMFGVAAFFIVINADRYARPFLTHPLFESHVVGTHYFVNDIVGVSPAQPNMPGAYILSHSARAGAVLIDEGGHKIVAADRYGLSQDKNIIGWGGVDESVAGDGVLQLYYYRTFIVGAFKPKATMTKPRRMKVSIPWPAIYNQSGGIDIVKQETDDKTTFDVIFNEAGRFWLEAHPAPSDGFSVDFIMHGFLPGEVLVGAELHVVEGNEFSLTTKDLHSIAMTELDSDPEVEFSVIRGGLRGRLGTIDPSAKDLLIDSSSSKDIADRYTGFNKNGCPGRQSAWVDIDSDGDLDLYVSCGRPKEPTAHFPNQLFQNTADGLKENARKFGIDFDPYGSFRFVDWDGDMDTDMWWADADGNLQYYENVDKHFMLRESLQGSWQGDHRSPQLLIRDMTNDGAPDLLVAHPSGGGLLLNQKGIFELKQLSEYGLPDETMVVHLADVDLDGLVDLLTATQGVYLNLGSLRFAAKEGELSDGFFVKDARLVSLADQHGRQFLIGYRTCLPGKLCGARRVALGFLRKLFPLGLDRLEVLGLIEPYDWTIQVLERNTVSDTHKEVAVSMQGSKGNPGVIGGRIDIYWNEHRQSHWVTESESSLYSSADMAIYISVPIAEQVRGQAVWPDNCRADFLLPAQPETLQIRRPASC